MSVFQIGTVALAVFIIFIYIKYGSFYEPKIKTIVFGSGVLISLTIITGFIWAKFAFEHQCTVSDYLLVTHAACGKFIGLFYGFLIGNTLLLIKKVLV